MCACRYVKNKFAWDEESMFESDGIYDTIPSTKSMPGEDERYLSIRSTHVMKNPKADDDEDRYATMSFTSEKPVPLEEDECYIMFEQSLCQQVMDSNEKVDKDM